MWARLVAALMIGLAVEAPSVGAEWETGNDLLRQCSRPMGSRLEAICLGYISGIADLEAVPLVIDGKSFCFPVGTTRTQLKETVIRYLKRNAEKRAGRAAAYSVFDAFVLSFPCNE